MTAVRKFEPKCQGKKLLPVFYNFCLCLINKKSFLEACNMIKYILRKIYNVGSGIRN